MEAVERLAFEFGFLFGEGILLIMSMHAETQKAVATIRVAGAAATQTIARTVAILTILLAVAVSAAGQTLADAPFRLTLPPGDWQFEGKEPVTVSSNLVRVAYATNATELRTVVIREQLRGISEGNLEQLAASTRSMLASNNVKVTETKTNFVGLPARLLAYEVKIGKETLYTETVLLVVGDANWTLAAIGPADRKDDIKQILTFYSKK